MGIFARQGQSHLQDVQGLDEGVAHLQQTPEGGLIVEQLLVSCDVQQGLWKHTDDV